MSGLEMLKHIERAGRTCYKSESKITEDSAIDFVKMVIKRGHESVLEHCSFTVKFVCDRGVSHELVRHRIASFSQESTRYVGYGDTIEFIIPPWCDDVFVQDGMEMEMDEFMIEDFACPTINWIMACYGSAKAYRRLLDWGWKPEQARSVLINSLKTEIQMTSNCREWRTVFRLRDSLAAHPQMRELMEPCHIRAAGMMPGIFED